MQNSKANFFLFFFFFLSLEIIFLCLLDPKIKKSQFKTKFGTKTNLNMQYFIVMFTFSILELFCKVFQKISLKFWCCLSNLVAETWSQWLSSFYHKKVVTWNLQYFYHKEIMMLSFLHRWDYCWKCEFDVDVKIENYCHHDAE